MPPEKQKEEQGFRTLAEAEEAYAKLQSKLGKQGEELGTLRQQMEQATNTLNQYAAWAQKAAPVVDWYRENAEEVQRRWQAFEPGGVVHNQGATNGQPQNGQAAQAAGQAAWAQAAQAVDQDPALQGLSPQQRQALISDVANTIMQQSLVPWTQNFSRQAQEYAKKAQDAVMATLKGHTDVLWRSLEHVIPKDKIEGLKKWHEQSLKFADPSKIDPMTHAREWMDLSSENETLKSQLADINKQKEEQAKAAAAPSVLGGAPPEGASAAAGRPASKQDRFDRVMEQVKTQHGPEGVQSLFGSR